LLWDELLKAQPFIVDIQTISTFAKRQKELTYSAHASLRRHNYVELHLRVSEHHCSLLFY